MNFYALVDGKAITLIDASWYGCLRYLHARLALTNRNVSDMFTQPPIEGARTFTDGQVLDVPAHLRVVHVPGHSEGSCALHHPGLDLMFTGDTLMTYDPMFGGDAGPIVFAEDPAHDETCSRNLELLLPSNPREYCPPTANPTPDKARSATQSPMRASLRDEGEQSRCLVCLDVRHRFLDS